MRLRARCLSAVAVLSVGVFGCGGEILDEAGADDVDVQSAGLLNTNGLRFNGLRFNGLRFNGLRFNGLNTNGLRFNGAFVDWFNNADSGDIALHAQTMQYVVGCALRTDQSTSFSDKNGFTHTWRGALGLAPTWFTAPATQADQDWLSSCLMAHVNTAPGGPKTIQISLRANHPSLSVTPLEAQTLTTFDGAYFGDLFASPNQMYVCNPTTTPVPNYVETLLTDWGRQYFFSSVACEGFTRVDCSTACTAGPTGALGYKYATCTAGGRQFRAMNAFVPKFSSIRTWLRSGTAILRTDCANCLDKVALDGLQKSSFASASKTGLITWSGTYIVDIRYANGSTVPQHIRFQANGIDVKNGTSNLWDFAPSGGADVWGHRAFRAYIPAKAKLTILSAGIGKAAPSIDTVSFRVP